MELIDIILLAADALLLLVLIIATAVICHKISVLKKSREKALEEVRNSAKRYAEEQAALKAEAEAKAKEEAEAKAKEEAEAKAAAEKQAEEEKAAKDKEKAPEVLEGRYAIYRVRPKNFKQEKDAEYQGDNVLIYKALGENEEADAGLDDVTEEPAVIVGEADAVAEEVAVTEKKPVAPRIPFAQKLLESEQEVQDKFDGVINELLTYRKVRYRISKRFVTVRNKEEILAKITYRGKTMKLHLALNPAEFDETIYRQKDLSEKKAYADVPFTVKLKSKKAYKNAFELITALAEKHGLEKKRTSKPVSTNEKLVAFMDRVNKKNNA